MSAGMGTDETFATARSEESFGDSQLPVTGHGLREVPLSTEAQGGLGLLAKEAARESQLGTSEQHLQQERSQRTSAW